MMINDATGAAAGLGTSSPVFIATLSHLQGIRIINVPSLAQWRGQELCPTFATGSSLGRQSSLARNWRELTLLDQRPSVGTSPIEILLENVVAVVLERREMFVL